MHHPTDRMAHITAFVTPVVSIEKHVSGTNCLLALPIFVLLKMLVSVMADTTGITKQHKL